MPSIIKVLADNIINKIAAGEVVERPASVVKELCENAIDAGANEIIVEIEQAGKGLIRITDNGCGMSADDAKTAFQRHATSKIRSDRDLEAVDTMGFRGEALSSIAAVSQVRLLTAEKDNGSGVLINIEAGQIRSVADAAAPQGTSLEISHLFYNMPARLKFLKSAATEFSHILTTLSRLAMSNRAIRFKLTHNKKTVLDLPTSESIRDRVYQLYGKELAENLVEFSGGRDTVLVTGLISRPAYTRGDRTYQDFYVNRRAVKSPSLTHALYNAYHGMLMRDRHPAAFIFIDIDPALVDVNVHPAKAEIRFRNQSQIHDLVRDVIREGLRTQATPPVTAEGDGVREALSAYFAGQPLTNGTPAGPQPMPLFGRRKTDAGSLPFRSDNGSVPLEPLNKLPEQTPTVASHGFFPLAQIHNSYIIAQSQEGMAIIDQHAAHERVLFEKLQTQCDAGNVPVQNLLIPVPVELGPDKSGVLAEQAPELGRLGIEVDDFGGGTFMIKAVPALLVGADYKRLLLDVLDEFTVHGTSGTVNKLRDDVLAVMACHPAIKVHRHLDMQEMEVLLNSLFACGMPHTCPHGRPTVVKFSMDEIRKMFKRT